MKKIAIGVLAAVIFFFGLWLIAVPDSLITGLIEDSLGDQDTKVEITGFRKGLLLNFRIERLQLTRKTPLLVLDNIRANIKPLHLLLMRIDISVEGDIARGRLSGDLSLKKSGNRIRVSVSGADIGSIPYVQNIGINGSGKLSGELDFRETSGELRFSVSDAKMENTSFSGVMLPLAMFSSAKAAVSLGNAAEVKSFAMEGKDIYARLKGKITNGDMDLQLELMPAASLAQNPLLLALSQYLVSPGYYLVPVRTRLN